MRKIFIAFILSNIILLGKAQQPVLGTTYFLPKTALRFTFLIEKTTYEPGELSIYAERFMKKTVPLTASKSYRIISYKMTPIAVPDSSKQFTLNLDKKLSINKVDLTDEGLLLAINAEGERTTLPQSFHPAKKPAKLNPRDYMNADILTANSSAKMSELIAREIYDIRDSRNQLTRGQAEKMPTDGEQLKIMMQSLDTQETVLNQLFDGVTEIDTIEQVITFVPKIDNEKTILFRFSKKLGMTDSDDLAGVPYYITINDQNQVPDESPKPDDKKKAKEDFGLNVNVPDKITVKLIAEGNTLKTYEAMAGQFGKTENLSSDLFGKKLTSKVILDPLTGSIKSIQSEVIN